MKSLLGQFYSRIKGSQEDIASEGLTYILQNSEMARDALYSIIQNACGLRFENLRFASQSIGKNLDRPDISGFNTDNREVLIFEAKFWASLTSNQPIEYLKRLENDSALIFICPKLRVQTIYEECLRRVNGSSMDYTSNEKDNIISFADNRFLIIKTWDDILLIIREALNKNYEHQMVSDMDQIIGFCHTIDSAAFLPLQSQDLSPGIPRRIINYFDLADKVLNTLVRRKVVNTKGLRASPKRSEYIRYFKSNNLAFALSVNFKNWANKADTPFWITIWEMTPKGNWEVTENLRRKQNTLVLQPGLDLGMHPMNDGGVQFSLLPLIEVTEDVLVDDLVRRIERMIDHLLKP